MRLGVLIASVLLCVSFSALTPGGTASATSSVGAVGVVLSSSAAGAGDIEYDVSFVTSASGALPDGSGTITLSGPAGTFDPGGLAMTTYNFIVSDTTSGTSIYPAQAIVAANGGTAKLTLMSGYPIAGRDSVDVAIYGVTNPTTTGLRSMGVLTSSDVSKATTSFGISARRSVGSASVSASSSAAGASGVQYAIGFTTSAIGGLATDPFNGQLSGVIILKGPSGLFAPGGKKMIQYNFVITDTTTGSVDYPGNVTVSADGTTSHVSLSLGQPIAAGDAVEVRVYGITNPAAPGGRTVSVATSTDSSTAGHLTLRTPQSVSTPSINVSSSVAGATGVSYALTFKTSTSGSLLSNGYPGMSGAITLAAPTGTVFSASTADFSISDETTGQSSAPGQVVLSSGGATARLSLNSVQAITAGDSIVVTAGSVTNTKATCQRKLHVATTSDTSSIGGTFSISGAPQPPTAITSGSLRWQAALSWSAPCNGGSPITDYLIDQYAGGKATGTPTVIDTGSSEPSYLVRHLVTGRTYTFTIRAKNAKGTSPASIPTSVVAGLPGAPSELTAVAQAGGVRLSWGAARGHGSPITDYRVDEYLGSKVAGSAVVVDTRSTGTSFSVTGLTPRQPYTFTVQALNRLGTGPSSPAASAIPLSG